MVNKLKINIVSVVFVTVYLLQMLFFIWMEKLNQGRLVRSGKEVPPGLEGFIDEAKLEQSTQYALENSRFAVIRHVIIASILLTVIVSGLLTLPAGSSSNGTLGYILSGLIFFLIFTVVFFLIDLPFDYYHTFVIEEKFGFNRSDLRTWVTDHVKSGLLSILFMGLILCPLLWAISVFPDYWWLLGFLIVSVIQLIVVVLYPILIAPLFNKFEPLEDQTLSEDVKKLIKGVGMKTDGIFQMDAGRRTRHTNAYFTGLGKTKRIVLFDTLIESHTHEEVLGVLAHEIGHYKLKHVLKSFILSLVSSLLGFYLTYRLMALSILPETFGFDASQSYVALFVIVIFWKKLGYFVKPLGMAISRRFEREADQFAKTLMKTSEPMLTALKRLAGDNLVNLNPHPFYVWFNYSHPPLLERVRLLTTPSKP